MLAAGRLVVTRTAGRQFTASTVGGPRVHHRTRGGSLTVLGAPETKREEDVEKQASDVDYERVGRYRRTDPSQANQSHQPASSKRSLAARITGVIGEILLTAGVVLLLFIVWQLWYTDFVTNREQTAEVSAVEQEFGGAVTVEDVGIGERQTGPPPDWATTPAVGDALGIMHIPAFGYDFAYQILNGTDLNTVLNTGAFGHYEDTALPGQVGNFSTAAHRQTYGSPMRNVADLEIGDVFVVETAEAFLVYRMVDEEIVLPNTVRVIAPDPFVARDVEAGRATSVPEPSRRLLTITTCHPPFVSNERWVVHGELDHWVKRSDGVPIELVEPAQVPDSYDGPAALSPANPGPGA